MVTPGRGWGRRQTAPAPMAAGTGLTEPASDPTPTGLSSSVSPDLCPLLAWQLGTLAASRDWSPLHSPPRARGQGFQHRNSQKPSLFIFHSCPCTSLHKPRTRGVWREQRRVWAQAFPETVYANCGGRLDLRSNGTINYRIRNVQKYSGGCRLASHLPVGVSYAHQSCAKVLGLARGAERVFSGTGAVLLPQQKGARGRAWGCVPKCHGPLGLRGFRACLCSLPLCPPFESVHAGVGS